MTDPPPDRPSTTSRRHPALLLAALAVAALVVGTIGPPLFGRGVFLAVDQATLGHPWQAYDSPGELNIGHHGPVTDTVDVVYPTRVTVAEGLRDGDFFAWNPFASGGSPAAAESSSGSLDPFALLYVVLPDWFTPAAIKLAQMAVAVGFTFLFGRRLGLARVPALLAGAAFAGSGFLVMWTNWPQPEVAALIAPLFWATERFLQGPSPARTAPIAVTVAFMLLGNFPSVVGYALYALVGYGAVRLLRRGGEPVGRRLITAGGVGAGVVMGVLLVAVVMLPFAYRLGDLDLSSREQGSGSIIGLAGLVTTVAPKALGLSTEPGNYFGPRNQTEVISFVGASTALLALLALCLPRPRAAPAGARLGLAIPTLVFGVATYGGGPLLDFLQRFPVFSNNFIGRSTSVMGFMVAALAGIGLQAASERRWPVSRWARALAVAVVGIALVVGGMALTRAADVADRAERSGDLTRGLWLPAAIAAGTITLLVVLWTRRPRAAQLAGAGVVVLLVVESLSLSLPLLPNEDRRLLYPETPGITFLSTNAGHDRVAAQGLTLFASATTMFGIRSATGHTFTADTWKQALLTADPRTFASSPTLAQLHAEPEVITSPMLDRLGARWFAAGTDHPPLGTFDENQVAGSSCERPVLLDGSLDLVVPAGEGLRGVRIRTCSEVLLPRDAVLTATAEVGDETATGHLRLPEVVGAGDLIVPVPADHLASDGDATISLTLQSGGAHALTLAATGFGTAAIDPLRPDDDGLRLAYADDLRVYERTRALPRIRWAGAARTIDDPERRLRALGAGTIPDDTVVLSEPGPAGSGDPGSVTVLLDAPTAVAVAVESEGDGYLVVADALQADWVATVDGQEADLVAADHAGVAVAVPEGRHTVELRYRPRGQRLGLAISLLTLLAIAVVSAAPIALGAWRRRGVRAAHLEAARGGAHPTDPSPVPAPQSSADGERRS